MTADKENAAEGDIVTLTVTPEPGYELDTLTVKDADGKAVAVSRVDGTAGDVLLMEAPVAGSTVTVAVVRYSFKMPKTNVTVSATFKKSGTEKEKEPEAGGDTYSVTIGDMENGNVEADKTSSVEKGVTVTLTVSPNPSYKLDALTIKDASNNPVEKNEVTAGTSYTFSMPGSNVTVSATFVQLYTITVPAATTHGTVTAKVGGVAAAQAASGETVTLTVTPVTGAKLESLSVKDASAAAVSTTEVTAGETYTFTMPSSNTTIGAGWEAVTKDSITAVGDVVLSTGKYIATENTAHMSDAQKAAAVAVIFDAAGRKGVGLKQGTSKAWAITTANGYGKNITTIAVSKTGGSNASDATFSDESSGSGNWDKLKNFLADGANGTSDDTGTAGNYPAWEWVNAYSTYATNLGTTYASGWYMPSIKELCDLYKVAATVNTSISNTGGTQMSTSWYWSSSQHASNYNSFAWDVDFGSGNLDYDPKDITESVCAVVRAF